MQAEALVPQPAYGNHTTLAIQPMQELNKKSRKLLRMDVQNPNRNNNQKNFHTFARAELTTSRAKRMSPWK